MVRYCYKTFLVSFICWSLLTVQSTALFAGVTTSPNAVTTDSTGNITSSKTYSFDKVKESDMLASITMMAGGFLTSRMITSYKPITTDVMVAAAGGAAFLAGEVLSNIKFKGTIDEKTITVEKHSDATVNEEQQQRLKDLRESYEDAKKATKTKKTLQLAAAAAFGVAALTATYMAFKEVAEVAQCRLAFQTVKTAVSACAATSVVNPSSASCALCTTKLLEHELKFNAYANSRELISPSIVNDAKTTPLFAALISPTGECKAILDPEVKTLTAELIVCDKAVLTLNGQKAAAAAPAVTNNSLIEKYLKLPLMANVSTPSIFENFLNIFVSQADAGWMPLLGFGASAVAAFYLITGDMALKVDNLMFIPRNRAIAFGLLAGLSLAASKASDSVIEKLDENIKKIDGILADIDKLGKGVKAKDVKQLVGLVKPTSTPVVLPSNNAKTATPCLGSTATSNCTPISSLISSSAGFTSLPESLQGLATDAIKLGDGVSGTSTLGAGVLGSAQALGDKQAAIGRALAKAQGDSSKLNLIKGAATPAQQQNALLDAIGARIKKGLQSKGMTPSGFLGSVGGSSIDSSLTNKSVSKEEVVLKGGKGPAPVELGGANGDQLKLDFKDHDLNIVPGGNGAASAATPEYDINTNEIAKENGPSIFEVISSRYLKSGYPKLLEVEPSKN